MSIPTRFVVTGDGSLSEPTGRPQRPPDGREMADPVRQGVWNVYGLVNMAEPGTRAQHIDAPTTPYQPNIRESRPSFATDHFRATFSAFLNRDLNRPAWAWHAAPVPAQPAPHITGPGQGPQTGSPQRIFPGLVTGWPRVVPTYKTLGSGG